MCYTYIYVCNVSVCTYVVNAYFLYVLRCWHVINVFTFADARTTKVALPYTFKKVAITQEQFKLYTSTYCCIILCKIPILIASIVEPSDKTSNLTKPAI